MRIILKDSRSVSEQLREKGITLSSSESLKIYYSFKKGKRRKLKAVRIYYHKPCSDGCCGSYLTYSRKDIPIW